MATPALDLRPSRGRGGMVRLRTLIILRWLAILGQCVAVFTASFLLNMKIELGFCLVAIGAAAISNLVAIAVYPENRRMPERDVMLTMLFDICQLAFLLYLTGGLNNPFALLLLAPVTVSAMTLRTRATFLLGGLALLFTTVLTVVHVPLRTANDAVLAMPSLFVIGFWVAMMIGIVFLAIYAGRVTRETEVMSRALLATQMALAREQKLTDLGGVVAAAAHELGTPLATIKLASAELMEELADRPELHEDAALIREQADRCRDILRSMGRAGKDDLHLRQAPLSAVLEEAAEPHQDRGKEIHFDYRSDRDEGLRQAPVILRKPEIVHGLRNLVQNAVDFAEGKVWVDAKWGDGRLTIRISDDGPGFPVDLLGRVGDPFVRRRSIIKRDDNRPEYEGMGLGLFIAKTLLERTGAEVSFANGSDPAEPAQDVIERGGAIAEVAWQLRDVVPPSGVASSRPLGENQPISA